VEFDLFTHIARGADGMSALVQATGLAENRLVTLVTALKSLGLITEHHERFVNAPATIWLWERRAISETTLGSSMTVEPKIPGAGSARRVSTQPGSKSEIATRHDEIRLPPKPEKALGLWTDSDALTPILSN
jgi:hypothetical protein